MVTYAIYKPYGFISQFTKEHESHKTLGDLFDFPKDVYPIGRLDKDSEGLLLLTNDNILKEKILNPASKIYKTYLVQVEGIPTSKNIESLKSGVKIKLGKNKFYNTSPAFVRQINEPILPDRNPPIRFRKSVPTRWLEIKICEGKNRQIRKMCAKVEIPVLRLVRKSVGYLSLDILGNQKVKELKHADTIQLTTR